MPSVITLDYRHKRVDIKIDRGDDLVSGPYQAKANGVPADISGWEMTAQVRQNRDDDDPTATLVVDKFDGAGADDWATGTVYDVGDMVLVAGAPFQCVVAHTSTTGGAHPTPPGNTDDWVSTLGVFYIEADAAVTEDLEGSFAWDLQRVADGKTRTLMGGKFVVDADVTRAT